MKRNKIPIFHFYTTKNYVCLFSHLYVANPLREWEWSYFPAMKTNCIRLSYLIKEFCDLVKSLILSNARNPQFYKMKKQTLIVRW